MNAVERFRAVMSFKKPDRLPVVEWAPWWDQTLARWFTEGLRADWKDKHEIREFLGLDCWRQISNGAMAKDCPAPPEHGAGIMKNEADYARIRPHLFPAIDYREHETVLAYAARHASGEMVLWLTLQGFFWFPRRLFGIEGHLFAFYDHPELMHRICEELTEHNLRVIEALCRVVTPDFMTFAEDMSYNKGPMLSKDLFDEFLAPCYRRVVPELKRRGILPLVDSDGDVTNLIPWLEEVGFEGLLPFERRSGVDVALIRKRHPRFRMIGAFDKTVMHLGEAAMRAEFERLLPVMRTGGFIPGVDHQTPPEVSFQDYQLFLRLFREYADRGAKA